MRVRFGDCELDPEARDLRRAGAAVLLSPKAFDLLVILVRERPRAVAQSILRDALWPHTHVGYTSLPRLVSEVRQALGAAGAEDGLIRTVPKIGYAFTAPIWSQAGNRTVGPCALVADDREFPLLEGDTLVGRGPHCGVRLPSARVSREHAIVRVGEGRVRLLDRGSKNGTWVNSLRLEPNGEADLEDGDELVFGTYRLVFRRLSDSSSTETAPRR